MLSALWHLTLWGLRRRRGFRVSGRSMLPLLKHGDVVLIDPAAEPVVGAVVLARHPLRTDTVILKRIDHITEDGRLYLLGDNPAESTDSRAFGTLSPALVQGTVVLRLTNGVQTC